jgi:ankyrin repeat protein
MKVIEKNEVEELNRILENEPIVKKSLEGAINKALQNYRNSSDTVEIIDSLLNHNGDPNHVVRLSNSQIDSEKTTILMYACKKGDLELVHTIIKHKPNVNMKDVYNRNALFYAINAALDAWGFAVIEGALIARDRGHRAIVCKALG